MRGETKLVSARMILADQMRWRGPESVALAVMDAPVKNARDSNRPTLASVGNGSDGPLHVGRRFGVALGSTCKKHD